MASAEPSPRPRPPRSRASVDIASASIPSILTPAAAGMKASSRLSQQVARLQRRLRHAHFDSVMALVAAVEAKDPYTERHSVQVAVYAEHFAREAGLTAAEVEVVVIAALLHDVGKIGIPDAILTKPGPLSPEEFAVIKEHPARGVAILRRIGFLEKELPLVLHHHEWYNGRGYPAGLAGEQIPLGARLVQTADCIDAMLSPRCYRRARNVSETIDELRRYRGTQFDPHIADLAINWLRRNAEEAASAGSAFANGPPKTFGAIGWPVPPLA